MIETIRQGLHKEGVVVSISQLCRWFEVLRRTFYYQSVKAPPKVQARFAEPIKAMIEDNPSFGYRTVLPQPLLDGVSRQARPPRNLRNLQAIPQEQPPHLAQHFHGDHLKHPASK